MMTLPLIYDLTLPELESLLENWGEPRYRAQQIWQGLYQRFWNTPEDFSSLPKTLRQKLSENLAFTHLTAERTLDSTDGETRKTLFRLPDGQAIEAVLMRYSKRRTLCISTQAGCAMGCTFCATGQMGFRRNLSSGEIVEQVLYYARHLAQEQEAVTNIVVMGMGEPFHNYESTLAAMHRLNDPQGYNFGQRRITISTVGLVPMIRRFTKDGGQINLAISLHAANDELRTTMLPIDKKYPISQVLEACRDYVTQTHRRVTFEWALIHEVNDTSEQAHQLGKLLKGLLCHVNAIPLNPTTGYNGKATTRQRAQEFQKILESYGVSCTIRLRRGIDIQAGCGQLAILA
ncbi:MAG: 23S rRNA (adenine(2503)-C(2))-methyltransferase RlmN [Anaerolineales bacterium]